MKQIVKQAIHLAFHSLGFDIVRTGNLQAALEQRDRARQLAYLTEIARLRSAQVVNKGGSTNKPVIQWVDRASLMESACMLMASATSVLDIGCAFRPQPYVDASVHVCCEPFDGYMERLIAETQSDGKYVYIKCTLEEACRLFPEASVDSVFLRDVIEHVERDSALGSLEYLKRMARHQVLIFTPIGYMPQDPDDADGVDQWGMSGVEWQRHRSGWTPDDFPSNEGWSVVACEDFHIDDGYGRPLDKPFGAMWAIWNRS